MCSSLASLTPCGTRALPGSARPWRPSSCSASSRRYSGCSLRASISTPGSRHIFSTKSRHSGSTTLLAGVYIIWLKTSSYLCLKVFLLLWHWSGSEQWNSQLRQVKKMVVGRITRQITPSLSSSSRWFQFYWQAHKYWNISLKLDRYSWCLFPGEPSIFDQHYQGCHHFLEDPILSHSTATAGEDYFTPLEAIRAERPPKRSFIVYLMLVH